VPIQDIHQLQAPCQWISVEGTAAVKQGTVSIVFIIKHITLKKKRIFLSPATFLPKYFCRC
jgi:hypothetical protein